ncbi:vitamin K epoxide reductase family protein [Flavobacterium taihuense]|uniref:Thioredoxin domain-containing protein n=1 Tax=Flavobacterium taihuense TaxID=2857508 RepID=A0ABS6XZA3_9FLAO|nr:vitamin K epoxide reductase family protein [Flavobacterium taihuense]MBW4362006.1 thioredoxin domain-containing protein [Flavobacterium taihuense]
MKNFTYLKKYLRKNQYYNLEDEFHMQLESHPNFPSLYAILDTFNFFEIENLAVKVEKEELENLPHSFLSVVNSDTGKEIVFTEKNKNNLTIEFSNGFKKKISKDEYLTIWTGIIVAIEANPINESHFLSSNKKHNVIIGAVFVLSTSLFFLVNKDNLITGIFYYLLLLTGLIISYFLVREEMGLHNDSISKICNVTEKASCKDVMSSKGANVFENVSLSDISILYFSSLTLFFVLNSFNLNSFIYSIIGVFSIPIILYSIYYQGFIIKKWCLLCLGIDTVLLLQLIIISFNFSLELNSIAIISFFSGILIVILFYFSGYEIKNRIQKISKYEITEIQNQKLKRNYFVFKALLKNNQKIDEEHLNSLQTIVIGKMESPITLFLVLSASCGHCHTVYEKAMKLVKKNPNEIKIQLIFNINIENTENPSNLIYKQASNYYWSGEVHKAIASLNDWHIETMDMEKWKSKWENNHLEYTSKMIPNQYNWCLDNAIHFTPAIILNGYIMPKEYQINDLNYFIDELIEEKLSYIEN